MSSSETSVAIEEITHSDQLNTPKKEIKWQSEKQSPEQSFNKTGNLGGGGGACL